MSWSPSDRRMPIDGCGCSISPRSQGPRSKGSQVVGPLFSSVEMLSLREDLASGWYSPAWWSSMSGGSSGQLFNALNSSSSVGVLPWFTASRSKLFNALDSFGLGRYLPLSAMALPRDTRSSVIVTTCEVFGDEVG